MQSLNQLYDELLRLELRRSEIENTVNAEWDKLLKKQSQSLSERLEAYHIRAKKRRNTQLVQASIKKAIEEHGLENISKTAKLAGVHPHQIRRYLNKIGRVVERQTQET